MKSYDLYREYIKSILKTAKSTPKQVLKASPVLIGLIIIGVINPYMVKLLLVVYLFFTSLVNVIKTGVFLDIEDFSTLKIAPNSFRFHLLYFIQRYFLDAYIFNTLVYLGIIVFTAFTDTLSLIFICLVILLNYLVASVEHIYAFENLRRILSLLTIKLLFIVAIIVLMANNIYLLNLNPIYIVGFYFLYGLCLFILYTKTGGALIIKNRSHQQLRFMLKPLKYIDLFLYKDILINSSSILQAFLISLSFLIFMDFDSSLFYIGIFIIFIPDSYLGIKNHKKLFKLTEEDEIFWCTRYSKKTLTVLKKKKILVFLSVWLVKICIGSSLLAFQNDFALANFLTFITLSLVITLNNFIKICGARTRFSWVYSIINLSLLSAILLHISIKLISPVVINIALTFVLMLAIINIIFYLSEENL